MFFPSVRVDATTLIDLFPIGDGRRVPRCRTSITSASSIEPADLDALAERFPGARRADGLFGAQGIASSLYVQDPDGNTVELRSY